MARRSKMAAARTALESRLDRYERDARRAAAGKKHPPCVVRGDAIHFGCASVDLVALRAHPDFHCVSDAWVRRQNPEAFLPYRRIARFESKRTKSKFWVYSQRQLPHLPQYRIAFFPDDDLGLQPKELSSVLELATKPRIARMELAFDFGFSSGVTSAYVRRHFISGKTQPHSAREAFQDSWGARNSAKFIRSYFKQEIGAHRLEIQFNGRFLRQHGIDTIFQFRRLAELIPGRHFRLAEIDEGKLISRLRGMRFWGGRVIEILKEAEQRKWHLCKALNYLRREVGMTNAQRVLEPKHMDVLARRALRAWARMWQEAPARLGRPK